MKYFKILLALLVTIQYIYQAVADMTIIQERLVNATNIITRIPFTTITSCFMKCSAHNKCSAIGFGVDPALKTNSECLLLKKVENYGIEKREGLVSVFVMIKNEEEFVTTKPVLPDCPVDGGYSDWSAFTTCSTSCDVGVQTRSRDCNNPFPRGAGANCSKLGNPTEQRTCNLTPCPRVNLPSAVSGYANGQVYIQGHVEVLYNGIWGTICDDFVQNDITNGNNVANVLCRMKGLKSGVYSNDFKQPSALKSSKIWLRFVKCNGNEGNIDQCALSSDGISSWDSTGCNHSEDIGIRCYLH